MAFSLTSETLMPTSIDSVSVLTISRRPKSVLRPYSLSKCNGWVFMVSSVNQVLSASVRVRPGQCS